jgi:SH3-like domain-containing protein
MDVRMEARAGRSLPGLARPLLVLVLVVLLGGQTAVETRGRSTGLPVPRFVSLASNQVNVRFGPGRQYPIHWVYTRAGLPVTITAEFDTWRKIRDWEGAEGWVHSSLLSSRRTVMIADRQRELKRTPEADARTVLRAEPYVLGELLVCEGVWCQVEIAERRGWVQRSEVWGVLPDEIIR